MQFGSGGFQRGILPPFFIPEDWLSVNRGLILKVTSKSDLVFVKRDEIAVIKQGLAYKEVVSV